MKISKPVKVKTYVLTVSENFPKTHIRAGESTNFIDSIGSKNKIHTIRGNYFLWKKRLEEVQKGSAVISIRTWIGKPYNSKQVEHFTLTKEDGVGVQKIKLNKDMLESGWVVGLLSFPQIPIRTLAVNDGLSKEDFTNWFEKYDFSEPMAIIHFTPFRYE